jgi:HlyD family secretion protein
MKSEIFFAILMSAGTILFFGCGGNQEKKADSIKPETRTEFFMAGKIESDEKIDIVSKINSRVVKIYADIGDRVKKGDPLVLLDINDISAQYENSRKNLENAKSNLDRVDDLFSKGYGSESQKENAEAQYLTAKAAYEQQKTAYEYGNMVSPITGIISARNVNEGDMALPNSALLTVINAAKLHVKASIPENMVARVRTGMNVVLRLSGEEAKLYHGKITAVIPYIDTKSISAVVKLDILDADTGLTPGVVVMAGIQDGKE